MSYIAEIGHRIGSTCLDEQWSAAIKTGGAHRIEIYRSETIEPYQSLHIWIDVEER